MRPYYSEDGIAIYHGDCLDVLPTLDVSPGAVVTDPALRHPRRRAAGVAGQQAPRQGSRSEP